MGFTKRWDVEDISRQIHAIGRECASPYNDGYNAFGCKQDLYKIKELVDQQLAKLPTFSGEEEWLQEQEKKRIIKILQL